MEWDERETDYPIIKLTESHEIGLSHWIAKTLKLAESADAEWNVLIADLWPNTGYNRLIGHVQMDNNPIGIDTGFRVCANLSGHPLKGEDSYELDFDYLESKLIEAVELKPAKDMLVCVNKEKSFEIRFTAYGDGPVSKAIPIWPYHL